MSTETSQRIAKNNSKKSNNTTELNQINNRIANEICHDSIAQLKDANLLNKYQDCKSVKKKINKLKILLEKHNIDDKKKELIINEYSLDLIPAGTKGVIRGNKFNDIVKNTIDHMNLDKNRFNVYFEKSCELIMTSEKPDWYIIEKKTNKVIIGMNQLALWGGGQQLNRGSKYLINNKINTNNSKLLCVICNDIKFKSTKNKAYKLFDVGYANNTLCYIRNIENIVNTFFK